MSPVESKVQLRGAGGFNAESSADSQESPGYELDTFLFLASTLY